VWKYVFILNTFVATVTYFVGFPAVWSGANPYLFFSRAAWVMSAYAIGECCGFFISEHVYLQKRVSTKYTILYAIALELLAAVLYWLTFAEIEP
jgi:hypothetical protein